MGTPTSNFCSLGVFGKVAEQGTVGRLTRCHPRTMHNGLIGDGSWIHNRNTCATISSGAP